MWNGIDFSQFGAFAIVFVLMGAAILFLVRELKIVQKKLDDSQEQRLQDAKEARDKTAETTEKLVTLTGQIYDLLTTNSSRRR